MWDKETDTLLESREGLKTLKSKIETALKNGRAEIGDDLEADFSDIKILETKPAISSEHTTETIPEKVTLYGCLLSVATCLGIFIFGCYSLIKLI
ncbi:hypothetical protein MLD52_00640 [Puniceicoccaceae bacterium K14]|nr:hypothetical protein [Puniceicoccaceae bacterium K14]